MVNYNFHPYETFSAEIGQRLARHPPANTDIISFTPTAITPDHLRLNEKERIKLSEQGAKELRKYTLERYKDLPLIIDLHDTPLYAGYWGQAYDYHYVLLYPSFNKKLGEKLEYFRQMLPHEKIDVTGDVMTRQPSYYSMTLESYPITFRNGKFEVLNVDNAEKFARSLIVFLQKNKG